MSYGSAEPEWGEIGDQTEPGSPGLLPSQLVGVPPAGNPVLWLVCVPGLQSWSEVLCLLTIRLMGRENEEDSPLPGYAVS